MALQLNGRMFEVSFDVLKQIVLKIIFNGMCVLFV